MLTTLNLTTRCVPSLATLRLVQHGTIDLFVGCHNLLVAQHVMYYRIADDVIIVGRMLHRSRNPSGKVNPYASNQGVLSR
jgi:hypothetical protein